ncbi:hypothetical protein [Nonomuraea dietziae]
MRAWRSLDRFDEHRPRCAPGCTASPR